MTNALKRCLDDIEARLNPDAEEEILGGWKDWAEHKIGSDKLPGLRPKSESVLEWQHININDALNDYEKMAIRELEGVHHRLSTGSNFPLRVRCNYGVATVATAFGCGLFEMPRQTDTLPNAIKLGGDACLALVDAPLPDENAGNFERVWLMGKLYREIADSYPKIGRYVHVEQPDLQGPMDNMELLWGSELFYALVDEPKAVHALLNKITAFISRQMNKWLELFPENRGTASYFRHSARGSLTIRNDSAMNLSPATFEQFIAPYDQRLLNEFGGIIHFCGRGDHFVPLLARYDNITGVNMSQPHLNDMDKVFANTIDKGIHLSLSIDYEPQGVHDWSNLLLLGNDK